MPSSTGTTPAEALEWQHAKYILGLFPDVSKIKRSKALSQHTLRPAPKKNRLSQRFFDSGPLIDTNNANFSTIKTDHRVVDCHGNIFYVTNSVAPFQRSYLKINNDIYAFHKKIYENNHSRIDSGRGHRKAYLVKNEAGSEFFLKIETRGRQYYKQQVENTEKKANKIDADLKAGVHEKRKIYNADGSIHVKTIILSPFKGQDLRALLNTKLDYNNGYDTRDSTIISAEQSIDIALLCIDKVKQLHTGASSIQHIQYIHRDIKPENFTVILNTQPDLCDVTLIDNEFVIPEKKGKKDKKFCGTCKYLNPQLLDGKVSYSFETDLYALGVTLRDILATITVKEERALNDTYKTKLTSVITQCFTMLLDATPSQPASIKIADVLIIKTAYEKSQQIKHLHKQASKPLCGRRVSRDSDDDSEVSQQTHGSHDALEQQVTKISVTSPNTNNTPDQTVHRVRSMIKLAIEIYQEHNKKNCGHLGFSFFAPNGIQGIWNTNALKVELEQCNDPDSIQRALMTFFTRTRMSNGSKPGCHNHSFISYLMNALALLDEQSLKYCHITTLALDKTVDYRSSDQTPKRMAYMLALSQWTSAAMTSFTSAPTESEQLRR